MLRRHAELLFQLVGMRVLLRQRLILVVDLTGIVDELLPVVRQRHAASAAVEDGDAELGSRSRMATDRLDWEM